MCRQLSSSQLNFFKILDEKIEMVSGTNKLYNILCNLLLSLFYLFNFVFFRVQILNKLLKNNVWRKFIVPIHC